MSEDTPGFRISRIELDDAEEVESITAVVRPATLPALRRHVTPQHQSQDGSLTTVVLAREQFCTLFRTAGRMSGNSPDYPHAYVIYNSLSRLIYGFIESD